MVGQTNLANFSRPNRAWGTKADRLRFDTFLTMRHRCRERPLIFLFDFSTILC